MAGYQSISALDSLYNDPMAMAALYSPNYYQILAAQNAEKTSSIPSTETTSKVASQAPVFEAAAAQSTPQNIRVVQTEPDYTTEYIVGGLLATGAACLFARHKGNGEMIKGFKTIGNDIVNLCKKGYNKVLGKSSEVSKNIFNVTDKNVQEFTVWKDGMQFVMRDGNPVKIVTSDKQALTKAEEIKKFIKDNNEVEKLIKGIKVGKTGEILPSGVSLSYMKESKDHAYRMFVEEGKVVKVLSKDKAGKYNEIPAKDLENFIKNHAGQVKDAETLTKSLGRKTIRLADGKTKTGTLKLSVRGGQVTEAVLDGKVLKLNEQEANMLANDFGKEISQYGKENPATYGLKDFEYIFRTKADASKGILGGQEFRFKTNVPGHIGENWVTSANIRNEKTLTETKAINDFLSKNDGIKTSLDTIVKGNSAEGFNIGNILYKSNDGNIYTVSNGKIKSIKLTDGKEIKGDKAIRDWCKTAVNNNEYSQICSIFNIKQA